MSYGRQVTVVGAGKTPFGSFPDKDLRTLAVEAGRKALANANMGPDAIEAFYLGNFAGPEFVEQNHLAPYISAALGIAGVPSTRFEAACASSGAAFFHAFMAVASGIYEAVMVLRRGKNDLTADASRDGDTGWGGGLRDRGEGRVHVSVAVRDDRATAYVRFRNNTRAPGGGRGEKPRRMAR